MKQKHTKYAQINTDKSMHSERGPVWQNPIQRTVGTAHRSVLMTVLSFSTQYNTEQFWWSSLLPPDLYFRDNWHCLQYILCVNVTELMLFAAGTVWWASVAATQTSTLTWVAPLSGTMYSKDRR